MCNLNLNFAEVIIGDKKSVKFFFMYDEDEGNVVLANLTEGHECLCDGAAFVLRQSVCPLSVRGTILKNI